MERFVINVRQYLRPIEIQASSENEARKIMEEKLSKKENPSSIEHVEFKIKNKNQSWLKTFIDNNF
jgi:hypothetical protein